MKAKGKKLSQRVYKLATAYAFDGAPDDSERSVNIRRLYCGASMDGFLAGYRACQRDQRARDRERGKA